MDDLIPLFIIIAISIIGAVARKKKRIEPDNSPRSRPQITSNSDLLKWMDDFVEEQPEPFFQKIYSAPAAEAAPTIPQSIVPDVVDNKYQSYTGFISPDEKKEMMAKEGESVFEKYDYDEGDLTKQGKFHESVEAPPLAYEFDLRTAVILSTILDRKYE